MPAPGNVEVVRAVGRKKFLMAGSFQANGAADPVAANNKGSAGWSVAHNATGRWRLTLTDAWLKLIAGKLSLQMAAPSLYKLEWGAIDVSVNKTLDINCVACSAVGWEKQAADAAANTATAETPMGRLEGDIPIGHTFWLVPAAAVVGSDVDYATITIYKRTAGGGSTIIAQITTKVTGGTNGMTAWLPIAIPTTVAASAGDSISFDIAKAGAGKVIPIFALTASGQQDIVSNAGNRIHFELTLGGDTVQA